MGWSFRKSIKIGPVRFNFSKSGIGASTGAAGANISTGPRGTFASLSRYGVRYSKRIAKPILEISKRINSPVYNKMPIHSSTSYNKPLTKKTIGSSANSVLHRLLKPLSLCNRIFKASNKHQTHLPDSRLIVFRDKLIAQIFSNTPSTFDYDQTVRKDGIPPSIAKDIAESILFSYIKHAVCDKKITVEENDKIKQIALILKIENAHIPILIQKAFNEVLLEN